MTHLVIAVVSIADYGGFQKLIADLRAERGLHKAYEFHHTHIPKTERAAFFDALRGASFGAWVLVVDKQRLPESFQRRNQYDLLGEFIAVLTDQLPAEAVENVLLVIDAHTTTTELTRSVRVAMSRALRARQMQPRVQKVRGRPAHGEDGLQLADMVAGAVMESRVRGGADHLAGLEDKIRIVRFE